MEPWIDGIHAVSCQRTTTLYPTSKSWGYLTADFSGGHSYSQTGNDRITWLGRAHNPLTPSGDTRSIHTEPQLHPLVREAVRRPPHTKNFFRSRYNTHKSL